MRSLFSAGAGKRRRARLAALRKSESRQRVWGALEGVTRGEQSRGEHAQAVKRCHEPPRRCRGARPRWQLRLLGPHCFKAQCLRPGSRQALAEGLSQLALHPHRGRSSDAPPTAERCVLSN